MDKYLISSSPNKYNISEFPFMDDLDTWHSGIISDEFTEHKNDLDGQFIPRISDFNGTDDGLTITTPLAMTVASYCITFKPMGFDATGHILGNTYTSRDYIRMDTSGAIRIEATSGGDLDTFSFAFNKNILYKIVITVTSGDLYSLYVDGIFEDSFTLSSNELNLSMIGSADGDRFFNGRIQNVIILNRVVTSGEITAYASGTIPTSPVLCIYPLGHGNYEYDLSTNANHATWAGTGDRFIYEGGGFIQGQYSQWTKSGSSDIQVPFNLAGAALSLTPGTNIETGYAKDGDIATSTTWWYMADTKLRMPAEKEDVFMDNIYKIGISTAPDFDGQYGFDIELDVDSPTNSIKSDLYVGLNGSWNLLKELTITADDLNVSEPVNMTRTVESDSNYGLAWKIQMTTGYLYIINSLEFVTAYSETRTKIAARQNTELKLSDYSTLQAAIAALNSAGAGSQLNIDENITMAADDTPGAITVNDAVIYSDNRSLITLAANNTGTTIIAFSGDNVHIMGVSINMDRDNQTNTHIGISHTGSTGFSVIGCDVRNGRGHLYASIGCTDGVYGACIALVSGDDCFTSTNASDECLFEFCVGGCSNEVVGSPHAFEFEDGDTSCTFYKSISFGQVEHGGFDTHVHPGEPSVDDILFEECASLYCTRGFTLTGENLTTNTAENVTITNCKAINSLFYSVLFVFAKSTTIENCDISIDEGDAFDGIELLNCETITVDGNTTGSIHSDICDSLTISNNDITAKDETTNGIYCDETDNSTIENNRVLNYTQKVIYLRHSDDNIVQNNTIVSGLIFLFIDGTSDGNSGTGNNTSYAFVDLSDVSSGTNTLTDPDLTLWNHRIDDGMFRRSNSKHSATAVTGFYLAEYPNDWHVTELSDFDTSNSFFESAYQDRLFAKIQSTDGEIVRYDEQLNYANKKTGDRLGDVKNYCNIT